MQRALVIAAASGRDARSPIEAALLHASVPLDALARAEQQGLVRMAPDRVRFTHPLLRAAVYGRAPLPSKEQAHLALAAVTDGAEAAWHRAAVAPGPDEAIAAELTVAGRLAADQGAHAAAADAFRRAAALTPPDGPVLRRLTDAVDSAQRAGRIRLATELGQRALTMARDPADRMRVLGSLTATMAASPSHIDTAALEQAVDELASVRPTDAGRALSWLALRAVNTLEFDAARRLLDRAATVSGHGSPIIEATLAAFRGDWPGATAQLADRPLQPATAPYPLLLALERHDDIEAWYDHAPLGEWTFVIRRVVAGMADLDCGRLGSAEDRLTVALAESVDNMIGMQRLAAAALARLFAMTGRIEDGRRLLTRTFEPIAPAELFDRAKISSLASRGAVELAAGDWHAAFDHLRRAGETARRCGVAEPAICDSWAFDLVDVAVRLGETDAAHRAADWLSSVAASTGSASMAARVRAAEAMLADGCDDDAFADALRLDSAAPRPLIAGRIRLSWAGRLRRERRRADARAQLVLARDGFASIGATTWTARAESDLGAIGDSSVRRAPNELSPHELAVAQKAATGMTIREIAGELYVSNKTVESHLSAVYRKLGVNSRVALADALRSRAG